MNRFEKYLNYNNEYSKKYGEKTIVLIAIGQFYEMFENKNGPELDQLCMLLNLHKAKSNNYNLIGFPILCADKYVKILIDADYTVVIIDKLVEIIRKAKWLEYDNPIEDKIDEEIITITI